MTYEKLFEALDAIINESGTWQEKRERVLKEANDTDLRNIEEFASWFQEETK